MSCLRVKRLVGKDVSCRGFHDRVTNVYAPWRNVLSADATSASLLNRFMWQGREYSHATGLYNFRARWYDPAAGRWLSKDPIGLEGGLNLYEAFGNNPVCFRDGTGKIPVIVIGAITAFGFGISVYYLAKNFKSSNNSDDDDLVGVVKDIVDDTTSTMTEISPDPWFGQSPFNDGNLIEGRISKPFWRNFWERVFRKPLMKSMGDETERSCP